MAAALVSLLTVAAAEMGDRTQLLALMLAAHYRKPWAVLAGLFCATLANHALAALVGASLGAVLTPALVDGITGAATLAMACWTLRPDRLSGAEPAWRRSTFAATLVAIFVSEMGDKTQLATAALAAGYGNLPAVVAGTTCGMLLANAPVVLIGGTFAERLPLGAIRYGTAALFLILGAYFLIAAFARGAAP